MTARNVIPSTETMQRGALGIVKLVIVGLCAAYASYVGRGFAIAENTKDITRNRSAIEKNVGSLSSLEQRTVAVETNIENLEHRADRIEDRID